MFARIIFRIYFALTATIKVARNSLQSAITLGETKIFLLLLSYSRKKIISSYNNMESKLKILTLTLLKYYLKIDFKSNYSH